VNLPKTSIGLLLDYPMHVGLRDPDVASGIDLDPPPGRFRGVEVCESARTALTRELISASAQPPRTRVGLHYSVFRGPPEPTWGTHQRFRSATSNRTSACAT
jgi:hypothetical protein